MAPPIPEPKKPRLGGVPARNFKLQPEGQAKVARILRKIAVVARGQPEVAEALKIALAAARGQEFQFSDYRQDMMKVQKSWTLGGHVSAKYKTWKMLFPEKELEPDLDQLRDGIHWEWAPKEHQDKMKAKFNLKPARPRSYPETEQRIRREMELDGHQQGYVEDVLDRDEKGWTSTMFWGMKPDGTYRWMQDLKALNYLMKKIPYKMENDRNIAEMLPQKAWMTSWDYRKFYWLFRLDRRSRRLQRFWDSTGKKLKECPCAH